MGRCDNDILIINLLNERCVALHHIAKLLDMAEVLAKLMLISLALLEGVKHDGLTIIQALYILLIGHKSHLSQTTQQFHIKAITQTLCHLADRLVAHTIDQQVGTRCCQHRALKSIRPIVVVGQTAQRCLDATHDNGGVGI